MGAASKNSRYVHHRLDVAELAGDPCAGLLFNLIVTYWRVIQHKPNSNNYAQITNLIFVRHGRWWIVKLSAEWMFETGLTERRYKNALSKLKQKGLIKTRTGKTWYNKSTMLRLTDKAAKLLPNDLSLTWLRVPTAEMLESWWVDAHHDAGLPAPKPWSKKEIRIAADSFGKDPMAQTQTMIEYTVCNWSELKLGIIRHKQDSSWYIEQKWTDHPSMVTIKTFHNAHFTWLSAHNVILPVDTWCEGGRADVDKIH